MKRALDAALAMVLLVVLFPAMTIVAVAVKFTSDGEIVFRQRRVGKDGRPFTIYKFRTMIQDTHRSPGSTRIYADDPRITPVGSFLRRTSLDELPQLVNVLKGEMSFVGPRPDLPHHVERYTPFQRQRLRMRPGITGWAQISGRNRLSWEERIKLDVGYLQGWSLIRDLIVLARTASVVLTGKGAALSRSIGDGGWDDANES